MDDDYMSSFEVCEITGWGLHELHDRVNAGELAAFRVDTERGPRIGYRRRDAQAWAGAGRPGPRP